jgi:hypothetical protein
MYLLLGYADDALGKGFRRALEKRGGQLRALPDLFSFRFVWRLDSTHSSSEVMLEDGMRLADSDISGVLLRQRKVAGVRSSRPDDYKYIEAEIEAASLGWIWSLACPVINRPPAWLWYCPKPPVQFWSRLLWTNGLHECDLGRPQGRGRLSKETSGERLGAGDSLKGCHLVCVVGRLVVWNNARPENVDRYESALVEFARCAGLSFLEVAMVKTSDGIRVKEVDPFPDLSRFCAPSASTIAEALAKLFTDSKR